MRACAALVITVGGLLAGGGSAYADDFPSCQNFQSRGPDGVVHVQVNPAGRVVWGVTMTPSSKSIGTWELFTLMGGKKTSSGFYRTVSLPYVPHGEVAETRPGLVFAVRGWVHAADGNQYWVVGAPCRVPR